MPDSTAAAALADVSALSAFDGKPVLRTAIKVTKAGDGLSEALAIDPREMHHGEIVHVVLECKVGRVQFDPVKGAEDHLVRTHVLVADVATIVAGELVDEVVDAQRRKIIAAKEAAAGISSLPGMGWNDQEVEALLAEHLDGQHAGGLREGCPSCAEEQAAIDAEADDAEGPGE